MAASDARYTAAAINAAAAAISSADPRYYAPERRRWKDSWARYWCFGSQKRDKRIVPTARGDGGMASGRGWASADLAHSGLSLAPPSSPASFANSSAHSPASFTLPLSAASASMCSPGPTNTMFTIGPYAHETQLVSPPVFSTFTTEPSTAPFTPPPELAHLTTPSSPDVPFAQLIASSLEARARAREAASPFSTSSLASPCDTPAGYIASSRHLNLCGRASQLIPQTPGFSGPETTSAVPDIEFPAQFSAFFVKPGSSFPAFEPFNSLTFDGPFSGARFQPDASNLETRLAFTSQKDDGMSSGSGTELGGCNGIQGTTQIMALGYANAAEGTKEEELRSVLPRRSGDSPSNEPAENSGQNAEAGYHVDMTCAASKRENIVTAKTKQSLAVVDECDKKGTVGGLSHSTKTSPDRKVADRIEPVFRLYDSSIEECYWARSGKTHRSPRQVLQDGFEC